MRTIRDENGREWEAVAVPNGSIRIRTGMTLAFRPVGEPDAEPLPTPITFNSPAAADLAIRSMSEKELLRRLEMASVVAGG